MTALVHRDRGSKSGHEQQQKLVALIIIKAAIRQQQTSESGSQNIPFLYSS